MNFLERFEGHKRQVSSVVNSIKSVLCTFEINFSSCPSEGSVLIR